MPDRTRQDKPVTGGKTNWAALDAMSDEEALAAALADPDAQPLDEGRGAHRMALAKRIRFKLKLSQQEFADRYHIPFASLNDWERHQSLPDAVATAFLDAIASDPEGVARALAKSKPAAAE